MNITATLIGAGESLTWPDPVLRTAVKMLVGRTRQRLLDKGVGFEGEFARRMADYPIATNTREANEQHYELPAEFFALMLGPQRKYSCCYYEAPGTSLAQAEECALAETAAHADLADGQRILELGCGWGSLSLWMAERYPHAAITAVSNSHAQKRFIDAKAQSLGLTNLAVITCDANVLAFAEGTRFDRVVSVEMFEHMRNYRMLMQRIAGWLAPRGTLFVHIFTHKSYAYPFGIRDDSDWMAKYFFTGGIMPSDGLLLYFQDDLRIAEHWRVDGGHYSRTSEHWLQNMDRHRADIEPILKAVYGEAEVGRWWVYWRVFFMSCAELWSYENGSEWMVSHYLFAKP